MRLAMTQSIRMIQAITLPSIFIPDFGTELEVEQASEYQILLSLLDKIREGKFIDPYHFRIESNREIFRHPLSKKLAVLGDELSDLLENYDCDKDSECSGNLKCDGPAGGALDGCCNPSDTWNTITKKCEAPCECTSGVCCDGCNYKSSNVVCDSQVSGSLQYICEGNCLGDGILSRYQKRY